MCPNVDNFKLSLILHFKKKCIRSAEPSADADSYYGGYAGYGLGYNGVYGGYASPYSLGYSGYSGVYGARSYGGLYGGRGYYYG